MVNYIITNMPGRARGEARVSKLYKLRKQGRLQEQPKVEPKKVEETVEDEEE